MTERFLEYLRVEKKYSPNTLTSYRRDLADFKAYLLQAQASDDFLKVTRQTVRHFLPYLHSKNICRRSINRKLSAVRSLYNFATDIGLIPQSPVDEVEALKYEPAKQIPFSAEEMQRLDEVLNNEQINILERTIIELLYQTGMRRAELCNLRLHDFDAQGLQLRVTGKGNKTRMVPVSTGLAALINDCIGQRPGTSEDFLLVNKSGKKITPSFVYSRIKKYLGLISSAKKRSPHILRHSFATHILDNGADISTVKELLGHSSLASTQVYTHANIQQLKKVFTAAHPRGGEEK